VEKKINFRLKSLFISKTLRGYYESPMESHRWPIDPCQFQRPWVTVKSGTQEIQFFWRIFFEFIRLIKSDRNWHGNTRGEKHVYRGSATGPERS